LHTNLPVTVTVTETQTETETPDGFALFWAAYPKKTAKPAALKAFKAQKVKGDVLDILKDVAMKSGSNDWQKENGQYVPNPATYLNQRRWEDSQAPAANPWAGSI
jgi:hypothetical protein